MEQGEKKMFTSGLSPAVSCLYRSNPNILFAPATAFSDSSAPDTPGPIVGCGMGVGVAVSLASSLLQLFLCTLQMQQDIQA